MASENFGNGGDGKKKGGYRGKRDGDRRENGRGGRDGKGFRTSDRRSEKGRGKGVHDGKDRRQRRDGKDDGFRRHDARSRSDRARPKNRSDRRDERARPEPKAPVQTQEVPKEQNLTIPSTPQRILFKGVDCEVNGRKDLAMVLYLHGAAQMSLGCENNMLRILREAGPKEFRTIRGRVAGSCPEDAMIAFDYLCATLDDGYDTGLIDTAADAAEEAKLPALAFDAVGDHFKAVITARKPFRELTLEDRLRICRQHCDLQYAKGEAMTLATLRGRLGVEPSNVGAVRRIVEEALVRQQIKLLNPGAAPRNRSYLPYWAPIGT